MSTTNEVSQNDVIVGDGTTTIIPFQFNWNDKDNNIDIIVTTIDIVTKVETVLVEGVDYNIILLDPFLMIYEPSILLATPLPAGKNLLVERKIVNIQSLDYQTNRPFPATTHERLVDRVFMSLSELKNLFKKVPKLSKFSSSSLDVTLPEPENGFYLAWDGTTGDLKNVQGTVDPIVQTSLEVLHDPSDSTLTAANVKAGLDQLDAKIISSVASIDSDISDLETNKVESASNLSSSPTEANVFKQKTGTNLEFRSLKSSIDTNLNIGNFTVDGNNVNINFPIQQVYINEVDFNDACVEAYNALASTTYGGALFGSDNIGRLRFYWVPARSFYIWIGPSTTDWISEDNSDYALMYAGQLGNGGTIPMPDPAPTAGSTVKRRLNSLEGKNPTNIVTFDAVNNQFQVVRTGFYEIEMWARAFRTERTYIKLNPTSIAEWGAWSENVGGATECRLGGSMRQQLFTGTNYYMQQFITTAGTPGSAFGLDVLGSASGQIYRWAELKIKRA